MSRYWDDAETRKRRVYRALIVDAYGDVSWDEYLRLSKRGGT